MPVISRQWRRRIRVACKRRLNFLLRQIIRPAPADVPNPAAVRHILVCRINHRLGNTLFLTPLLNALEATFPAATVDVVLGDEAFAPLLGNRPNVGEVFGFTPWRWRGIAQFLRLVRQLRKASYDLVIDPCHDSISGRMVSALVHASGRVGFQTPDQWLPLTNPVAPSDQPGHAARVPLALVRIFATPETAPFKDRLDIRLSPAEIRAGACELRGRTQDAVTSGQKTIGFFVDARDNKRLPASWWDGWVEAIRQQAPDVSLVQLVAPGASAAYSGIPFLECVDLRRLGAMLANLDLFVSGDTGPMHLASAVGVATVGLFTVTNPDHYGPIGPDDESLKVSSMDPALAAERTLRRLEEAPRFLTAL